MTYNGWTNYETWLTNLWFENFDFTDHIEDGVFDDMSSDDIVVWVSDYIKEYVYETVYETQSHGGFVDDMLNSALQEVDWGDIADHYVDDIESQLKERDNSTTSVS